MHACIHTHTRQFIQWRLNACSRCWHFVHKGRQSLNLLASILHKLHTHMVHGSRNSLSHSFLGSRQFMTAHVQLPTMTSTAYHRCTPPLTIHTLYYSGELACGITSLSISSATSFPIVSLTASRTASHTRRCAPVPGPRVNQRQRRFPQAPSTSPWRFSLMLFKTAALTPRSTPTSYHLAATRHTTCSLSSLIVGAEKRGFSESSEEPDRRWQISRIA